MKKNENVKHVMQGIEDLEVVHLDHKPSDVRKLLAAHRVHHVPVVSGDKIVGLVSATDMLKMTFTAYGGDDRAFDAYLDHEFTIEQIMTKSLITLSPEQTIRDAAELLGEGHFHALPVVTGEDTFLGLVTSTDLIRHLRSLYD